MTSTESWVDIAEVAMHLQVTKDSIYRWVDSKGFPAHRVGRLLRFQLSEVDDWVRAGGEGQSRNRSMTKTTRERTGGGIGENV